MAGDPAAFPYCELAILKCLSRDSLGCFNDLSFPIGSLFHRNRPLWKSKSHDRYDRSKLRYLSDLVDAEWAVIQPLIPAAMWGGNKCPVAMRKVLNGLMHILRTGCHQ